jgi:hypothetical protein
MFDRPNSFSRIAAIMLLMLMGCQHTLNAAPKRQVVHVDQSCGYPTGKWSEQGTEMEHMVIHNRLDIGSSSMRWNDKIISMATLRRYLSMVSKMVPQPITVMVFAPKADCRALNDVRQLMDERLGCSTKRACVEYSQAEWMKAHPPLPPCDANCRAYGRAISSDRPLSLTPKQKQRLKKKYIDKYGFIPW